MEKLQHQWQKLPCLFHNWQQTSLQWGTSCQLLPTHLLVLYPSMMQAVTYCSRKRIKPYSRQRVSLFFKSGEKRNFQDYGASLSNPTTRVYIITEQQTRKVARRTVLTTCQSYRLYSAICMRQQAFQLNIHGLKQAKKETLIHGPY